MRALADSFATGLFRRALVEVVLVGLLTGAVGVHVLLRRLSFFVVATSHATFPGLAIAAAAGVSIQLGGWLAGLLLVAVLAVAAGDSGSAGPRKGDTDGADEARGMGARVGATGGSRRRVEETSLVGIALAAFFAVGVLVISAGGGTSTQLSGYLVGSVLTISDGDVVLTAAVALVVGIVLLALHKELVFGAFDPVGAAAVGYPARRVDAAVALVVMVALVAVVPAAGSLLGTALLIVPALTARLWTERVGAMMAVGAGVGAAGGVVGLCLSALFDVAVGGAIVLVSAAAFALSFGIRECRGGWRRRRSVLGPAVGALAEEVEAMVAGGESTGLGGQPGRFGQGPLDPG